MSTEPTRRLTRRQALKRIAAASGAVAFSNMPQTWQTPLVEVGILPAHAQGSAISLEDDFAVMGTFNEIVIFPSANTNLPNPQQIPVSGLPTDANSQGVAIFGSSGALIGDWFNSRIFIVDLRTATLTGTLDTSGTGVNGTGTVAVAPGSAYALTLGESNQLGVIEAPFTSDSVIKTVDMPAKTGHFQTQAIVFDANGRAFVYNKSGITVLDPPYDSIAFTIPTGSFNAGGSSENGSGAIAISPDGNTLLITNFDSAEVRIFTAPFSAASIPSVLTLPSGILDGIVITPDGTKSLVCVVSVPPVVYVISAPFTSSSTVQQIPLPNSIDGFEDIGISADGQLAIATGGTSSASDHPAVFIRAPFSASSTVFAVDITGGGRGAGSVRFNPS